MYTKVTSGSTCVRVKSKEDCEEAARQLGHSDSEAIEENISNWPPYCYFYDGNQYEKGIYFNKNGSAVSECNYDTKVCICKRSTRKYLTLICANNF